MPTATEPSKVGCGCSPSALLCRSIVLIDPPPRRAAADDDDAATVEKAATAEAATVEEAATTTTTTTTSDVDEDYKERVGRRKRVRFDVGYESDHPSATVREMRPNISAADAVQAYVLLVHAASIVTAVASPSSSSSSSKSSSRGFEDVNEFDLKAAISIGWEELAVMADVHRALLVASCLLLELLPQTTTSSSDASNDGGDYLHDGMYDDVDDDTRPKGGVVEFPPPICPSTTAYHRDDTRARMVPELSPSIEYEILATCRSCVRHLRSLERACAAKAIYSTCRCRRMDDGRDDCATSTTTTTKTAASASYDSPTTKLLPNHEGGDDIHDYDRPMSDLSDNYDWHDDGFLTPPSSYFSHDDDGGGGPHRSSTTSSSCVDAHHHTSSILRDCFHRKRYPTDPPSSKFERCARTRDWIRDKRLISLNLEDYAYPRPSRDDVYDAGDYELLCEEAVEDRDGRPPDDTTNDEDKDGYGDDNNSDDDGEGEGWGSISLNISSDALAIEEKLLLDVMLADGRASSSSPTPGSSSGNCSGCYHEFGGMKASLGDSRRRVDSVKAMRKKKRQRKLAARRLRLAASNDDAVRIDRTSLSRRSPAAREGYLLLVHEEGESVGREKHWHIFHDGPKVESVRVYARLHPSGWLSVEDRSIRRRVEFRRDDGDRDDDVDTDESTTEPNQQPRQQQRQRQRQQQLQHLRARPLPPRMRFLHFYIDPYTSCSPWMREGTTSFQFRLNDILFLGASSLYNQPFDIGTENNNNNSINRNNNISNGASTSSIVERAHLLFGIDEGTGGEFIDGFEWVNCIESRIAIE